MIKSLSRLSVLKAIVEGLINIAKKILLESLDYDRIQD